MRMISPNVINTPLGFARFYLPFSFVRVRRPSLGDRGLRPPSFDTATFCVFVLAVGTIPAKIITDVSIKLIPKQ